MITLILSGFLIGVTSLGVAVFIPFIATKPHHKLWIYFNYLVGWWGFSLMMVAFSGTNREAADLWWKTITLPGMFIPVALYHFIVRFCDWKVSRLNLIFAYSQALVFWLLFANGFIGYELKLFYDSYYYVQITSWSYGLLFAVWLGYTAYAFLALLLSLRHSTPEKSIQIKYMFAALIISVGSGSAFHWLSAFGIPVHPATNFLLFMFFLLASYSIFRERLAFMDSKVRKSLVYTILASILTALYLVGVYFVENMVLRRSIGYSSPIATVIMLSIVIFSVEPLRLSLQASIDRFFYKGNLSRLERQKELLQDEVIRQDRMKSIAQFAAGMAHEIKNPLTSIKTFAEYLPAKYDDPGFRDNFSKLVTAEIQRINDTVTGLLDFAKPRPLDIKDVDAAALLDEVLALMSNQFLSGHITTTKNYEGPVTITADRHSMKQVFHNLLLNASQAMPQGGALSVGIRSTGKQTEIYFEDSGPGVKEEILPQIFEPFFTTKESGSGLGLSIVYSIVEKHGGRITATNTGRGLRISVYL